MGQNNRKKHVKESLIKIGLAGILAFQTMAPSILSVVRAEEGNLVNEEVAAEVVETEESLNYEEVVEAPVMEEYESHPEETIVEEVLEESIEDIISEDHSEIPQIEEMVEEIEEVSTPQTIEKQETIQVTLAELLANPNGLMKTTNDGEIQFEIYSYQYVDGIRAENFRFHVYANSVSLVSQANNELESDSFYLSYTLDKQGNVIESNNEGYLSYKTVEGDLVNYAISLAVVGGFDVEEITIDKLPSKDIATYTSSDGRLQLEVDNGRSYLNYESMANDWVIYNYRTDYLDTRYSTYSYHVIMYSLSTNEVKLYHILSNNTLDEDETLNQESLELTLNRNNRYETNNEEYVFSNKYEGISLVGHYDRDSETYTVVLNNTSTMFWGANNYYQFKTSDTQEFHNFYLEHSEYDEEEGNTVVTDRIKVSLTIDDQEVEYSEEEITYYYQFDFNEIQIGSNLLELPEIPIDHNEHRKEKYYLGYDVNGLYSEQAGFSTEGAFVLFKWDEYTQYPEYNGVQYLEADGIIYSWLGHGSRIEFTITGMPEVEAEHVSLDVTMKHNIDNKLTVELDNLIIEAYYLGYRFGAYELNFSTPANDNYFIEYQNGYVSDDTAEEIREIRVLDYRTGITISKYLISFNFETREVIGTDDGGFGFTDEEITYRKSETILLTMEDLKNFSRDNQLVKLIDETFFVDLNFSSWAYGDRNENISYDASLPKSLIWPVNENDDQIVLFGNPAYWSLRSEKNSTGYENSGTNLIYYRSANGEITEYELTLAIDEIVEPETVNVEFSSELDGETFQTPNQDLTISVDYDHRLLLVNPADGWSVLEQQIEVDTRYEHFNYYVHLYSDSGEVKVYQLIVSPILDGENVIKVDLSLNKNNRMELGTEVYEDIHNLGNSFLYGYYDIYQEKYYIQFNSDYDYFNGWGNLVFDSDEVDESVTGYIEEKIYDYEDNSYRVGKRIEITVNLDNETEVDYEKQLFFEETVQFEELVIESLTDKPHELKLAYNEERTESFLIAYDAVGLFKDWHGHSTKDKFVRVYNQDGVNVLESVLYESIPGTIETYAPSYGNWIKITVEGMPELIKESIEMPVTLEHDFNNPLKVISKAFPNLSLSTYHGHSAEYWSTNYILDVPQYDYDGVYELGYIYDWEYSISDDTDSFTQVIDIKRVGEGNRLVGQIEVIYSFEAPQYVDRETISINLVEQNANNYFEMQHAMSEDGLVVLSSRYNVYNFEESFYEEFTLFGNLTPKAIEEGYELIGYNEIGRIGNSNLNENDYLFTHAPGILIKHADSNTIYNYPIQPTVSDEVGQDNLEVRTFEFKGNAADLMKLQYSDRGNIYGKPIVLKVSDFETMDAFIFLDINNYFSAFTEETPAEERYLFFEKRMHRFFSIMNKIDEFTYEVALDDFSKVRINIEDPEQEMIEVRDLQLEGEDVIDGKLTLSGGDISTLIAKIKPVNATNQLLVWTSSNPAVATILNNGDIYAIASGKTTITVETHNGLTDSIEVEVKNNAPLIEVEDEFYRDVVKVSGPSTAIPRGATLRVEPIKEEAIAYQQMNTLTNGRMTMFDISLFNQQENISVQPNAPLMVSVKIPDGYDASKLKMYYFDDRTGAREEMPGYVEGDYYVFEVSHFSYYVLVEEELTETEPVISEKLTEKTETIPFEIIRQANDELEVGIEKVIVEGMNGVRTITFKETYQDDELISSEKMSEAITTQPVHEVIEYGTKAKESESESAPEDEEESKDESDSSDESHPDEDSSDETDEESSDETNSEDETDKDDETPVEAEELSIKVEHVWQGVSLNNQTTNFSGEFTREVVKVKAGEEFSVKALTVADVQLEAIEGFYEFIAPTDLTVTASADQKTITMKYQVVQKNTEEQVSALEEMVVKAKATIASIEAKEVVAKSLFDGWIRSVSAQTLTFDEAQAILISQVKALTAYLSLIEQGGYISASSIDQILVTTQAAIDDLVAAGQEKEDSSPEKSTQTVTKGKTKDKMKDGQLPNTGETSLVWLSALGLGVLSLGVALVGMYFKRNKQ